MLFGDSKMVWTQALLWISGQWNRVVTSPATIQCRARYTRGLDNSQYLLKEQQQQKTRIAEHIFCAVHWGYSHERNPVPSWSGTESSNYGFLRWYPSPSHCPACPCGSLHWPASFTPSLHPEVAPIAIELETVPVLALISQCVASPRDSCKSKRIYKDKNTV